MPARRSAHRTPSPNTNSFTVSDPDPGAYPENAFGKGVGQDVWYGVGDTEEEERRKRDEGREGGREKQERETEQGKERERERGREQ